MGASTGGGGRSRARLGDKEEWRWAGVWFRNEWLSTTSQGDAHTLTIVAGRGSECGIRRMGGNWSGVKLGAVDGRRAHHSSRSGRALVTARPDSPAAH